MNDVFHQAAFGKFFIQVELLPSKTHLFPSGQKTSPTKLRGVYSIFNISDLESKTVS